jgi:hypothetical protein
MKNLKHHTLILALLTSTAAGATHLPESQLKIGRYNVHLSFHDGPSFVDELIVKKTLLKPDLNFLGKYSDFCAYMYAKRDSNSYFIEAKFASPGRFSVPILQNGACDLVHPDGETIDLPFVLDEGNGEEKYRLSLRISHAENSLTESTGVFYRYNGYTYVDIGSFRLERK